MPRSIVGYRAPKVRLNAVTFNSLSRAPVTRGDALSPFRRGGGQRFSAVFTAA